MGCCCSADVDPPGSPIIAYIRTTVFIRQRGDLLVQRYIRPSVPRVVYIRANKLYFERFSCVIGGYPIANITTVEVIRGGKLVLRRRGEREKVYILNQGESVSVDRGVARWIYRPFECEFTGVRMTGSDGTMIAFAATSEEAEVFIQQLRSAIDVAKTTELQQNVTHSP